MDKINTFLALTQDSYETPDLDHNPLRLRTRPIIICKSGLRLSIQASMFHYCRPREDHGPYRMVEVAADQMIDRFGAPNSAPSSAMYVYNYVPVHDVEQVLEDNGGIQKYLTRW